MIIIYYLLLNEIIYFLHFISIKKNYMTIDINFFFVNIFIINIFIFY